MRAAWITAFAFAGAIPAFADDISGTWTISGPVTPICSFTQADGKLTGACKGPGAQGLLTGTISGDTIRWTYNWIEYASGGAGAFEFSGTLNGDSISGTMNDRGGTARINGAGRSFTAKRQPGMPPVQLAAAPSPSRAPSLPATVPPVPELPRNVQSRSTSTATDTPEPLIRLSMGQTCNAFPGGAFRGGDRVGGAVIYYLVQADGMVTGVNIVASTGNLQLDGFLARCVKSWKFEPLSMTNTPAPYAAHATAIVVFQGGARREAATQWQTPDLKNASDVAINQIAALAFACLRADPAVPAAARAAAADTALRLSLRHGEISKVAVTSSSGSDALDKAAIACYQAVAYDDKRGQMMDALTDADVSLHWRVLFAGAP